MPLFQCFRASRGNSLSQLDDDRPEAARRVSSAKKTRNISRQSSGASDASSTCSNESISKLPPCKRESDAKIDSMMMPVPCERPSKCMRLSHPKIYSSLVYDMKSSKGCRDWRNFAVFYNDDVDMSITADEAARKKAIEYQRKVRELNSFESSTHSSIEVDMIG